MKTKLHLIDVQQDFMTPSDGEGLYDPEGPARMARITQKLVDSGKLKPRPSVCSMLFGGWEPSYEALGISHGEFWRDEDPIPKPTMTNPQFWRDESGNPPAPNTQISAQDVQDGTYRPAELHVSGLYSHPHSTEKTAQDMRACGIDHVVIQDDVLPESIWPDHCMVTKPE